VYSAHNVHIVVVTLVGDTSPRGEGGPGFISRRAFVEGRRAILYWSEEKLPDGRATTDEIT